MASIHKFTMPGEMVKRGFWLYVWRADTPKGERLYVGRTGDNSSPYASSVYERMGQHLVSNKKVTSNQLRKSLEKYNIIPEECKKHEIVSYGPMYKEIGLKDGQDRKEQFEKHRKPRDKIAPLEKRLCDVLTDSGYSVLNTVPGKGECDEELWEEVYDAFKDDFPNMKPIEPQRTQ